MTWQGYADLDGQPGYVRVTLGQFGPNRAILVNFPTPILTTVERDEGTQTEAQNPLQLPLEMAEVLYKALDRIFGNHQETGVTDVLTDVLKKEQARVDFVLERALRVAAPAPQDQPVG